MDLQSLSRVYKRRRYQDHKHNQEKRPPYNVPAVENRWSEAYDSLKLEKKVAIATGPAPISLSIRRRETDIQQRRRRCISQQDYNRVSWQKSLLLRRRFQS
jgi:hypothetical protein